MRKLLAIAASAGFCIVAVAVELDFKEPGMQ